MDNSMLVFGYFTVILVLVWFLRAVQTKKYSFYLFMIWNMALAVIPALVVVALNYPKDVADFWVIIGGFIWLLFLPNTFYLLTDFLHLNPKVLVNQRAGKYISVASYERGDPAYIFDSFLLFATTFFGALCGGFALMEFYDIFAGIWPLIAEGVMGISVIAVGVGVYIGRFGRWNSWDAFTKPWAIVVDFVQQMTFRKELTRMLIVTMTIVVFQIFSWVLVANLK